MSALSGRAGSVLSDEASALDSGLLVRMQAALYESDHLQFLMRLFWEAVSEEEGVGQEEYVLLNVRLQKSLLSDFQLNEAVDSARGDWSGEAHTTAGGEGRDLMEYDGLSMFLLELCTIWCPLPPTLQDYLFFLATLYLSVTKSQGRLRVGLTASVDDVKVLPPAFFALLTTDTPVSARKAALDSDWDDWLYHISADHLVRDAISAAQRKAFAVTNDARAPRMFGPFLKGEVSEGLTVGRSAGLRGGRIRGRLKKKESSPNRVLLKVTGSSTAASARRRCSTVISPLEGQLSSTVDGVKYCGGELEKPSLSESPREVGSTASRKLMRAPALVDGMRTRDEEMWTVVRKLRDVSEAYTKLRCPKRNGHVHGPYDVVEGSLGKLESANKRGFENCEELIRRLVRAFVVWYVRWGSKALEGRPSSPAEEKEEARRNNKPSSLAAPTTTAGPVSAGSILAKEPPAAVAMSPAPTTVGADSPLEPKSPVDQIDSPQPAVSSSAARRRRRRRRAHEAVQEEEEPKPVELTKSQLKRKKRLQRKAEAEQDEPKPLKADPSLFPPVPDFPSKAKMDAIIDATTKNKLRELEWPDFQALVNSLDQQ
ncbi:hypothetical protein FOZ62_029378, partial [Perkinsus olseni]